MRPRLLFNRFRELAEQYQPAFEKEAREMSMAIARRRESFIREELMKLRTHRMNVILEIRDSGWHGPSGFRDMPEFHYSERLRLRLLLPRGARPLP